MTTATHFTSSVATEQDYTEGLNTAAQPTSPIQAEVNDHNRDEGK
jgi:hypothetical protein